MSSRADDLIASLKLAPHPEGGHYREVHRSARRVVRTDTDADADERADADTDERADPDTNERADVVSDAHANAGTSAAPVERSALTVIHFLLRAGECSRWHVVESDEAWQFDEGDPLRLVTLDPATGARDEIILGRHADDRTSLHVVPAGVWQAAVAVSGAANDGVSDSASDVADNAASDAASEPTLGYSLVTCTVGPGFEFDDFRFVADLDGHAAILARAGTEDDARLL